MTELEATLVEKGYTPAQFGFGAHSWVRGGYKVVHEFGWPEAIVLVGLMLFLLGLIKL